MARKARERAKPHPIDEVRRHAKFGATKAQTDRYKRERDLANRVFELEQILAAAAAPVPNGVVLTLSEMNSLRAIVRLPFSTVHSLDLVEEVRVISSLANRAGFASGKVSP